MEATVEKFSCQKKYFATPHGSQKHREASHRYYEKNKEIINQKRREARKKQHEITPVQVETLY